MIHHGETEIAPIFRTDSSVLIQKELSLMPMGLGLATVIKLMNHFNSFSVSLKLCFSEKSS